MDPEQMTRQLLLGDRPEAVAREIAQDPATAEAVLSFLAVGLKAASYWMAGKWDTDWRALLEQVIELGGDILEGDPTPDQST